MGALSWWSRRRRWSRVRREGRILHKQVRRALASDRTLPDEVAAAADTADQALRGEDLDEAETAVRHLEEVGDRHHLLTHKSTVREYTESIGVAVIIALLLRAFVVEAFQIPSGSMIPTLEIGDHIFVSKFSYGLSIPFTNSKILKLHAPQRGDVIVFKYPRDPSTDYIKRVVGLPGETVEVRHGEVFIDRQPMARHWQGAYPCGEGEVGNGDAHECDLWTENLEGVSHTVIQERRVFREDSPPVKIPPDHVFVMGDNRDNSSDSRFWGTVDYDLIKGKALIIWWSRRPSDGFSDWFKAIRWSRFFHPVR